LRYTAYAFALAETVLEVMSCLQKKAGVLRSKCTGRVCYSTLPLNSLYKTPSY